MLRIPIWPIRDGVCSCPKKEKCSSPGKHPKNSNGLKGARESWEETDCNWAVLTGAENGIVVLDIDAKHDGEAALAELERFRGTLPTTLKVRTGGGGLHFYFKHPGRKVPNSAGKLAKGVDVRGDGGYVLVPPSNHISGSEYVVEVEAPLAPMPSWISESRGSGTSSLLDSAPVDLQGLRERLKSSKMQAKAEMQALLDGSLRLVKGSRDVTVHALAFTLGSWGVPLSSVQGLFASPFATMDGAEEREEFEKKLAQSHERGVASFEENKAVKEAANQFFEVKTESDDWKTKLATIETKGGVLRLENHTANLELIFDNDPLFKDSIRFNNLTRRIEVVRGPLSGTDENSMDTMLSNWLFHPPYNSRISRDTCMAALNLQARKREHDPVREYLLALPKWDGQHRLSNMLFEYARAEGNDQYICMVSRKFMISAVARALRPGCQVDTMLVLQGTQGVGKTSFARAIGAGFHVETRLDISNKDSVMVATANWIVELGELAALKRSDVESTRAFLSTKEDQIRLPYSRAIEKFPRRCVFIGTTNSRTPLVDDEGNRRFWVVSVRGVDADKLAAAVPMIWAEALHAYRSGEEWWLTATEARMAATENRAYEADDVVEEMLMQYFQKLIANRQKVPARFSVLDVATRAMGMEVYQVTPKLQSSIVGTLVRLGFERVRARVEGARQWVYEVPESFIKKLESEE